MPRSVLREGWERTDRALRRARAAQRRRGQGRSGVARSLTMAVCAVAGFLGVASATNARGIDLRPSRNTDLVSLVSDQSRRNAELTAKLTGLRAEVDQLSAQQTGAGSSRASLDQAASAAGLTAVSGPVVTVTLDDAPDTVAADGVDPDLLVVHQQDIQAVANALWSGGAEAMTIQGQRVISTTGIKCVGNTVVLHGIPYAPPYVISAIGDPARLRAALAESPAITIYRQYVDAFGLTYRERTDTKVTLPGHAGALDLHYATPPNGWATPSDTPTPR